jgi:hypothetical protein
MRLGDRAQRQERPWDIAGNIERLQRRLEISGSQFWIGAKLCDFGLMMGDKATRSAHF